MARKNKIAFLVLFCTLIMSGIQASFLPICNCTITKAQKGASLTIGAFGFYSPAELTAAKIAVATINSDKVILPNNNLTMVASTQVGRYEGVKYLTAACISCFNGVVGLATSEVAQTLAASAPVFNTSVISYSATASILGNFANFPTFARVVPDNQLQAHAMVDFLVLYSFLTIGAVSEANIYGAEGIKELRSYGSPRGVNVISYQQFVSGKVDLDTELSNLRTSGARVFVSWASVDDMQTIVGPHWVWLCSDACATTELIETDGTVNSNILAAARGMIGFRPRGGAGKNYDSFVQLWQSLNATLYPGAGPGTLPPFYAAYAYDAVYVYAYAFQNLIRNGRYFDVVHIFDAIIKTKFVGLTGLIQFTDQLKDNNVGDRVSAYEICNMQPKQKEFVVVGYWNATSGLKFVSSIIWYDGTTNIPFLDLRKPFDYWNCPSGKDLYDPYGYKKLDAVDDSPVDIFSYYQCDQFIDCTNISDEHFSCDSSFVASYIFLGIITLICMVIGLVFVPFTIAFGYIWKRKRVRASSPVCLLVLVLACELGYGCIFASMGKPNDFQCNFAVWLFGLALTLMISALLVKSFRVWLIFKEKAPKITNEFYVLIGILILVAPMVLILILWAIIGDYRADLIYVRGADHVVCSGNTAATIVFLIFGALYLLLLTLFTLIVSLLVECTEVPTMFNENRVIALSIYNIAFIYIVLLPVTLSMRQQTPQNGWVIMLWGVFCTDRKRKDKNGDTQTDTWAFQQSKENSSTSTNTASEKEDSNNSSAE